MREMSDQQDEKKQRRPRRSFTDEFKAGAVQLVLEEGKTVAQVARDLDLNASALGNWVAQARADRDGGKSGLTSEERSELARLRKENRELKMERDILKKSRSLLREGEQVRFALVETEKANYSVTRLCKYLGVSPAGFYAWRKRPASKHARDDERLRFLIREAYERSRRTYGSPRVHAELRAGDVRVSRKRVVRLMQDLEGADLRLHRGLLQPAAPPLVARLHQPCRLRTWSATGRGGLRRQRTRLIWEKRTEYRIKRRQHTQPVHEIGSGPLDRMPHYRRWKAFITAGQVLDTFPTDSRSTSSSGAAGVVAGADVCAR